MKRLYARTGVARRRSAASRSAARCRAVSETVYQFSLVLTYAIAILGLNLLMGFNGQISVAHGVFFAVGGYTTAIFMTRYGVNYLATPPLAAATAALLGFVVGVPALRWQGLPLAFITFGLAVLVPPIALKLEPITKGATGISMPKPEPPAVSRQPGHVPLPGLPRRRRDLRADRVAAHARRHRTLAARRARQRADRGVARHEPDGGAARGVHHQRGSRASAGCSRS